MTPERWQQIDRLYHAALEVEEKERIRFLAEACGGDVELRAEVESLLATHEQAGGFLFEPAMEEVAREFKAEPSTLLGLRLGPYEVVGLIGAGGMGEVYKARDTRLNRTVAIKVLPRYLAVQPERRQRFEREAQAIAGLSHPHICAIHDIGSHEGVDFLVMELVEGETLEKKLQKGPLRLEESLRIAIQITEALENAHRAGIIHRDLKPSNIVVSEEGLVKILDFGLAKLTHPAHCAVPDIVKSSESLTGSGAIVGTVAYMSPEQALGKEVDSRSDLFSLGVVLYELATGTLPFRGDSPVATCDAILHSAPTAPVRLNPECSGELERIINRLLEKDRDLRYQDAADLRAELKRLKRDIESREPAFCQAKAGSNLRTWKPGLWLVIVTLLAIIVVPLAWHLFRERAGIVREPLRIVPFTTLPGSELNPKFSPDGKFVAFEWNGPAQDNWDIYVKQAGRGEQPFRLTNDPAVDVSPAWSPDGGEIAFVRESRGVTSIYAVSSLGGVERKLYELESPSGASNVSWSSDGRWLAFSEKSAVENPARICLLSLSTREKIPLTSPPSGPWGDFAPEFSPDGKRLAFVRRIGFPAMDLWIQPVPSGDATRLTYENYSGISRPAWTGDGSEMIFGASYALYASSAIFRIPATGGMRQPIGGIGQNASTPAVSGNRMVFSQLSVWRQSFWRMRGPNYQGKDRSAAPILPSTSRDVDPHYSPDGKKLAFGSIRSGFWEIWISDSDGSKPVQLTSLRKISGNPRWSPDGKRIAFACRLDENLEIYLVDADGGVPQRLTNDKSQDEFPNWSRDGRWIYFTSNRNGSYQVWKMPAEGGTAVQITRGGGYRVEESFDDRTLYYLKPGQRSYGIGPIWKVAREGGEETPVTDREISSAMWTLRPEGIYFTSKASKRFSIELLNLQTGEIAPIYQDETPNNRSYLTVSPDGEWFLYSEYPPRESDLMLVENFH